MANGKNITQEFLLTAYQKGVFPVAQSRDTEELVWCFPKKRGIIPLSRFQIPKDLGQLFHKRPFDITMDAAFSEVLLRATATPHRRSGAWINPALEALYIGLFKSGDAHSIECWKNGRLMAGLFGVAIGSAFFWEGCFGAETDAGDVALVALIAALREGGYQLLDTQYIDERLKWFGAQEIPAALYVRLLRRALETDATLKLAVVDEVEG